MARALVYKDGKFTKSYRKIGFREMWGGIMRGRKSPLHRMELRIVGFFFISVPFSYIHVLFPDCKEFFFFRSGYYTDLRAFVEHFVFWLILSLLSSAFFLLCRRRWSFCVGLLAFNYWWHALCALGWGLGVLKEGEYLYVLFPVLAGFYCLGGYKYRWSKQVYGDRMESGSWRAGDYCMAGFMFFCISLTYLYKFFPEGQDFYFLHSEYLKNIQHFAFFFGVIFSAVLWMIIWFFECKEWYQSYISWPLTMFFVQFVGLLTVEFGLVKREEGYYYVIPVAVFLIAVLWRSRLRLCHYIYPERGRLVKSSRVDWKDWVIMGLLGLAWLFRPDFPRAVYIPLLRSGWLSGTPYPVWIVSEVLVDVFFIVVFFLWMQYCKWFWRLLILIPLLAGVFLLLVHLGVDPYRNSGCYMSVVALIVGQQVWRMRAYLFWNMFCGGDLQRWEALERLEEIRKAKEVKKSWEDFEKQLGRQRKRSGCESNSSSCETKSKR